MSVLLRDFPEFLFNDTFKIADDFDHYVTADTWTTTASDSGTVAVQNAVGGILKINPSSNGSNSQVINDETYVESTAELFKLATNKPIFFAAKVRPVADTISNLAAYVGLMDAVAADALVDTTGVPKTSTDQLGFYKANAAANWTCVAEANSTEDARLTLTSGQGSGKAVGNNAWDILVIKTEPITSTLTDVHFQFANMQTDGSYSLEEVGLVTPDDTRQFVAQQITHTSAAEMAICLGVKAGATNDSEYLDVDWVYCAQKR